MHPMTASPSDPSAARYHHPSGDQASPGLQEALRMLKARAGPATEDDRPRRESKPPRVLEGQLDLLADVHADDKPS
jgi:hypothetical protein